MFISRKQCTCGAMDISHKWVFVKCTVSALQFVVGLIYLKHGLDPEFTCENFHSACVYVEEVRPSEPIILGEDFNAPIGNLNQVAEEAVPLGVGASTTRSVSDREFFKRGSALVECLEAHSFDFFNMASFG